MAGKILICCMDARFFGQTHLYTKGFFQTGSFYLISVAGGVKVLADLQRSLGNEEINGADLREAWKKDSMLNSILIVLEENPTAQILLVAHANRCKAYEVAGMLDDVAPEDEVNFQFGELLLASFAIRNLFDEARIEMRVAEMVQGSLVPKFHSPQGSKGCCGEM